MYRKEPAGSIRTGRRLTDGSYVIARWLDPPLKFDREIHLLTTKGLRHFPLTQLVEVVK